MSQYFRCQDCAEIARWKVWYRSRAIPPMMETEYNCLCTEHVASDMRNGRDGWDVWVVKAFAGQERQTRGEAEP